MATDQRFDVVMRILREVRYQDPERAKQDVFAVLQQVPFLSAKLGTLMRPDGVPAKLLCLDGTIQTYYQGREYQTPVCIYVPELYPVHCPVVYLRPTANMFVAPGHPNVDASGLVYMPYLHGWRAGDSNLVDMIGAAVSVFSAVPPLRARPAGAMAVTSTGPSMYPPQQNVGAGMAMGGQQQMPPYMIQQQQQQQALAQQQARMGPQQQQQPLGGFGGYGAPQGQTTSAAATQPQMAQQQQMQTPAAARPPAVKSDKERREEAIDTVTALLQHEMQELLLATRDDIDQSSDAVDKLEKRQAGLMAALDDLRTAIATQQSHGDELDRCIAAASAWLETHSHDVVVAGAQALTLGTGSSSGFGAKAAAARRRPGFDSGDSAGMVPSSSSSSLSHGRRSSAVGGGTGAGTPLTSPTTGEPIIDASGSKTPNAAPSSFEGGATNNSNSSGTGPQLVSVEDVVVPPTRLQAQLLEAVAEDAAIEDVHFHLLAALKAGRIDLDSMLKEVRELSRRQFRARALARKIDAALAAKAAAEGSSQASGSRPVSGAMQPLIAPGIAQAARAPPAAAGAVGAPSAPYPSLS